MRKNVPSPVTRPRTSTVRVGREEGARRAASPEDNGARLLLSLRSARKPRPGHGFRLLRDEAAPWLASGLRDENIGRLGMLGRRVFFASSPPFGSAHRFAPS